jgi:hypothetical protein
MNQEAIERDLQLEKTEALTKHDYLNGYLNWLNNKQAAILHNK